MLKSKFMHLYPFMPVLWVPSALVSHVWEPNGELGGFFKTQITSASVQTVRINEHKYTSYSNCSILKIEASVLQLLCTSQISFTPVAG